MRLEELDDEFPIRMKMWFIDDINHGGMTGTLCTFP
jgi:hypothetical protein